MFNNFKEINVKICCIKSNNEAHQAFNYGASSIGLVSKMPSGPGIISDRLIKQISESSPTSLKTILLTSDTDPYKIVNQYKKVRTVNIQLVSQINDDDYEVFRQALPNTKLIQVIHVIDEISITNAINISNHVDYLLLDTGRPKNKVELGGTGRVHDWNISRLIRDRVNIPVILAGGLNHRNVKKAVEKVEPFGVDVCSGVRTNDKLDLIKLKKFFNSLKKIKSIID